MGFDWNTIGLSLAGVSFGLIAVIMIGGMLWQEQAEKAKKMIFTVIQGLVLLGISGLLLNAFGG